MAEWIVTPRAGAQRLITGRSAERSDSLELPGTEPSAPAAIAHLQHSAGNQAVSALMQHGVTADRTRHLAPARVPQPAATDLAEVGPEGGPISSVLGQRINAARGLGTPLDSDTRSRMEGAFGSSFADVRVHRDERAHSLSRNLGATAFTTGSDIFFRSGAYQPDSPSGQFVLGHELAHVLQQRSQPTGDPLRVGPAGDRHEREADAAAQNALTGRPPLLRQPHQPLGSTGPLVQRFQAGEPGHGGAEHRALKQAGFTDDEVDQVYVGNWLRDMSQFPSSDAGFAIVNTLAWGEFGHAITREELGGYVPSEHLDNPAGGETIEDTLTPGNQSKFKTSWEGLSERQKEEFRRENAEQAAIAAASAASGLPPYIERGKLHAKDQLDVAVRAGATPEGRKALGEALHAVEDYFSHSNFTEAAIWTMQQRGEAVGPLLDLMAKTPLGMKAAVAGGLDDKGNPKIVTGTYGGFANPAVSLFEALKSELEHGELTKAFAKGWLKMNGITAEEASRRVGRDILGTAGAGVGSFIGSLVGGGIGSASGYQLGAKAGEVAGTAIGGAVGAVLADDPVSIDEIVRRIGPEAVMLTYPAIRSTMNSLVAALKADLDRAAGAGVKVSAVEAYVSGVAGPTHSQIAKDAPDHPLFRLSMRLAEEALAKIAGAMKRCWTTDLGPDSPAPVPTHAEHVNNPKDLIDEFVAPPQRTTWWESIVRSAATR